MNAMLPSAQAMFDVSHRLSSQNITKSSSQGQCGECALRKLCLPKVCGAKSTELEAVVQHSKPLMRRKDVLFRQGDNFDALYVIRAGSVKASMINENGEEHITGFYLPGDIIGIDGISSGRHATTAAALETTSICTLPFAALEKLATTVPEVQRYVFQVMAKEILQDQKMMFLLSSKTAEQRLAALLLRFSEHLENRKLFSEEIRLSMSRNDIANYLGLAVETVCRAMTRFQKQALLRVDGRSITLLDSGALDKLVKAVSHAA